MGGSLLRGFRIVFFIFPNAIYGGFPVVNLVAPAFYRASALSFARCFQHAQYLLIKTWVGPTVASHKLVVVFLTGPGNDA